MQTAILKVAIQKSGRLSDASKQLLKECGIKIKNGGGKLLSPATNFPIQILNLRDDDIPQYVEDGIADIGILGENVVLEAQKQVAISTRLGFAACRLSLAIPKTATYTDISFFEGKKIATSYPQILINYLQQQNVQAEIHKISGSVEIAPSIGLADAVCDIVSSGSTLFSNGLKEVEVIMQSEAVLIKQTQLAPEKQAILDQLLFRIQAVKKAESSKYILLNAPNTAIPKIKSIIPGMKSPTIIPLAEEGWSALHSVVEERQFWEVIDQLKAIGAQGILVIPIEKMIV